MVEFVDINFNRCVLLLDIGRNGEVELLCFYFGCGHHLAEILNLSLVELCLVNLPDVLVAQLVLVAFMDKLVACIDEADTVVGLVLLQDNDAGGNGRAEEKVLRQLDNSINIIVSYQKLANLLLSTTTI